MAKKNPNVTYQLCFPKIYLEECICRGSKFFPHIYFQLYHQVLLFYIGIYFIKHLDIVACNNYHATDSHYIKRSILKPITES